MRILDGKVVSKEILDDVKIKIEKLEKKLRLVVIQVGNDEAGSIYVRQKRNMAINLGVNFEYIKFSENVVEQDLVNVINKLNMNDDVDGILVQLPLPKEIDAKKVIDSISPDKDVDGISNSNVFKLNNNEDGLVSCTALGVVELLNYYGISVVNKNIVVVGRSVLVGKPISKLFSNNGGNVRVCHSKTKNLKQYTSSADILVVGVGIKYFITKDMIKDGVVLVDVGINRVDGKIYGDVDFLNVCGRCSYVTPVPGGVGPMTIAMLYKNLLKAYNLRKGKKAR